MRILLTIGDAYLPQLSGGAQSSTHQLATQLIARGHEVAVLCRLIGGGWTVIGSRIQRRLGRKRFSRDTQLGYSVYRAWDPTDASEVISRFQPSVALVQNGETMAIARSLHSRGVPVALYFRNVEFKELGGDPSQLPGARFIANSSFTARRHQETFGVSCTVIPPFVDARLYQTASTRETITFVNPSAVKGLDVALGVAELCPDLPFTFIQGWGTNAELRTQLETRLARLANVTLLPPLGDMRKIYSRTRILLAPSQWEEAWGRVATEAHFSGIPVVASRRGGLPEAVGPGGIVLDHDAPVEEWASEVRRLWKDVTHYNRVSNAASDYSRRPEMQPDHQIGMLIEVLDQVSGSINEGGTERRLTS